MQAGHRALRRRRQLLVASGLAALCLAPAVVAAVPAGSVSIGAADLLAKVRGSAGVAYSGYAEAAARLGLPDVPRIGRAVDLLSQTARLRVWWRSPSEWRVDQLDLVGERDTYQAGLDVWTWDSGERRATVVRGQPVVRLVRASDLTPPELGRRLAAAAAPAELRRIAARTVAGRLAAGVRITPTARETTVDHVDIYADPATGLPLRVAVVAKGGPAPVIDTQFLDLDLHQPGARVTSFRPPADAEVDASDAPDIAAAIENYSPFAVPTSIGGRRLRSRVGAGAGTYGEGFSVVAVVPLPGDELRRLRRRLGASGAHRVARTDGVVVTTPLLNAVAFAAPADDTAWLLSGAVSVAALDRFAVALADASLSSRGR